MVFWEWKVSLNLQINLWRIDIFTTLNFSTQEHGIYTSLLKCTYLHFRNFFFSSYRFYTFLVKFMSKYFFKFSYYKCSLLCCYFNLFFMFMKTFGFCMLILSHSFTKFSIFRAFFPYSFSSVQSLSCVRLLATP